MTTSFFLKKNVQRKKFILDGDNTFTIIDGDGFSEERNSMQQWIKMFEQSVLETAERIYKENRVEISSRTQDMMKAKVHGQKMHEVVVA